MFTYMHRCMFMHVGHLYATSTFLTTPLCWTMTFPCKYTSRRTQYAFVCGFPLASVLPMS